MKVKSTLIVAALVIMVFSGAAFAGNIPVGTQLSVRITENLSSAHAKVGQAFHGTLEAPVVANGHTLYPKGAQITGQIVAVHPSGRLSDPGVLDLKLVSVSSGRSSSPLDTQVFHIKGESHAKSNAAKIGGTAAAGTVLGAIFGGGKGALIGAGAGAAAGTVAAAATGKKEAVVESEAVLPFVTSGAANVAVAQAAPPPAPVAQPSPEPQAAPVAREVESEYRDDAPAYSRRDRDDDDDDRDESRYRHESYRDDDRYRDRGYAQAFSDRDRRIIRNCFAEEYSDLPPGLAKREGHLPPGLERHLQRDGTLPPGLQKRVQPLPEACERRLGAVPEGWFRGVLSGRVLLLDDEDRIIDIFVLHTGE